MPDSAPYMGPYSPEAYSSSDPASYTDSSASSKPKFDWNNAFTGILGSLSNVAPIISAVKGGSQPNTAAYNGSNDPAPTDKNKNIWLYGILAFFVLLIIIIGIIAAVKSSKKNKTQS